MRKISSVRNEIQKIPGTMLDIPPPGLKDHGKIASIAYDGAKGDRRKGPELEAVSIDSENEDPNFQTEPTVIFEIPPDIEKSKATEFLSDSAGVALKAKFLIYGIDALAWYSSFHVKNAQWGIYIKIEGLLFLASIFDGEDLPLSRKLELALHYLHRHELFHFATDYMSSQWELVSGKPCWLPARKLRDAQLGYNVFEETMAEAYALRGFRFPSANLREPRATDHFKKLMMSSPPGYRDGHKFQNKSRFFMGCEQLSMNYESSIERDFRVSQNGFDHLICPQETGPFLIRVFLR